MLPRHILRAALPPCAAVYTLLFAFLVAASMYEPPQATATVVPSAQVENIELSACVEDMPCWSWPTMGNHKRGVVTLWGTPLVVGPCRFSRLYRHGNLSYPPAAHMRGDRWAIQHGCRH